MDEILDTLKPTLAPAPPLPQLTKLLVVLIPVSLLVYYRQTVLIPIPGAGPFHWEIQWLLRGIVITGAIAVVIQFWQNTVRVRVIGVVYLALLGFRIWFNWGERFPASWMRLIYETTEGISVLILWIYVMAQLVQRPQASLIWRYSWWLSYGHLGVLLLYNHTVISALPDISGMLALVLGSIWGYVTLKHQLTLKRYPTSEQWLILTGSLLFPVFWVIRVVFMKVRVLEFSNIPNELPPMFVLGKAWLWNLGWTACFLWYLAALIFYQRKKHPNKKAALK